MLNQVEILTNNLIAKALNAYLGSCMRHIFTSEDNFVCQHALDDFKDNTHICVSILQVPFLH